MIYLFADYGNFPGSWDEFFTLYQDRGVVYGKSIDWSLGWWHQRHRHNVLVVLYEDLMKKPAEEVKKIAGFIGVDVSEQKIAQILDEASVKSMRRNKATNGENMPQYKGDFIRKGDVGNWREYFSEEQAAIIDEEYEAKAGASGLTFQFS